MQDYTAKLSDFGLAKDGPQGDETHVTTRVMGTHGYAAPEYVMTGHLTKKSDVYSFGVVLLELLSGRRAVDKNRPQREMNLVGWARPYLNKPGRLCRFMDASLEGQYSTTGAHKAATVAYKCLSLNPKNRPTMKAVVDELEVLLRLEDDVPVGTFVYTAPPEEKRPDEDAKAKNGRHSSSHRNSHEHRHKRRFPNSAIHSEVTLQRNSPRAYQRRPLASSGV